MDTGKRLSGTLVRWNDDRGFGFLAADGGGPQVFLHVSALAADSPRPALNERFTFEATVDAQGKLSAMRVRRPTEQARPRAQPRPRRTNGRSDNRSNSRPWAGALLLLTAIGGTGWYAYQRPDTTAILRAMPAATSRPAAAAAGYACDGRTHCSQMNSCAQARYFLAQCPNTQMDGDGDGEPCERQWCR